MSRCSRPIVPAVVLLLFAGVIPALTQTPAATLPHETLFYTHDNLRLEAYLYRPAGAGPFPLIVYNHGSAPPGEEAVEWPAPFIARQFVPAGYAVLVPERRGYGKSEGMPFSKDIGQDRDWDRSDEMRKALLEAAGRIRVPVSCSVAENDLTTESARGICAAANASGTKTVLKIYPAFNSGRERPGNPPGHALFGPFGVDLWREDVLAFLAEYTRTP